MRLSEWDDIPYVLGDKEQTNSFVDYLNGVWEDRVRYMEDLQEVAKEKQRARSMGKQRFFDITFDGKIYARNYVGVVQYEGIRVEVYPKILKDRSTARDNWQLNLLYWMSYCNKIRFPFALANIAQMQFDDFLECLIYVFANYTNEIISLQPLQSYQSIEEDTPFLKGRLVFDGYIKNNVTTGNWQRFYCEHSPFIHDNSFNRIVKYVTRRLMVISDNERNKRKLERICFLLDDVSDVCCSVQDCDQVKLNPLYEGHANILSLCRLYLSGQVMDVRNDDSRNFCFLVPMEYVFEDFVFGFIADKWPSLNIKSQSEKWLTSDKSFWIKNDIYIKDRMVIDTKYKIRPVDADSKAGVSHTDLYQMISYAISRNCSKVLLLYPATSNELNNDKDFFVSSELLNVEINIQTRDIDITFDEIGEADQLLTSRIRRLAPFF